MDLDHVALATRDVTPALDTLVGDFGGTVLFGGQGVGFRPMQVRLGDAEEGMTIELLEPWAVDENDFLERFLSRHGDGPHHLTFKVDDIGATLERLRAAGYTPVNIDLRDPDWKEAFLLPREAHGTVVQLAEAHHEFATRRELLEHVARHGANGHPRWWPEPPAPRGERGVLRRVVMATTSLTATLGFLTGILGGDEVTAGEGWAEVGWPGGGRIRVEERDRLARPGVDRLELDVDGPSREMTVAGARFVVARRQLR